MAFKRKVDIDRDKAIFHKWWDNAPAIMRNMDVRPELLIAQMCFDAGRKAEREIHTFTDSDLKRITKLVKNEIRVRKCHISLEGLFDLENKIKKLKGDIKA